MDNTHEQREWALKQALLRSRSDTREGTVVRRAKKFLEFLGVDSAAAPRVALPPPPPPATNGAAPKPLPVSSERAIRTARVTFALAVLAAKKAYAQELAFLGPNIPPAQMPDEANTLGYAIEALHGNAAPATKPPRVTPENIQRFRDQAAKARAVLAAKRAAAKNGGVRTGPSG